MQNKFERDEKEINRVLSNLDVITDSVRKLATVSEGTITAFNKMEKGYIAIKDKTDVLTMALKEFQNVYSQLNAVFEKQNTQLDSLVATMEKVYINAEKSFTTNLKKQETMVKSINEIVSKNDMVNKNTVIQQSLKKVEAIAQSQHDAIDHIAEIVKAQKAMEQKLSSVANALSGTTANKIEFDTDDIQKFIGEQKDELYNSFKKEMHKEIESVIKKTNANFEKRIADLVNYISESRNEQENQGTEHSDINESQSHDAVSATDFEIIDEEEDEDRTLTVATGDGKLLFIITFPVGTSRELIDKINRFVYGGVGEWDINDKTCIISCDDVTEDIEFDIAKSSWTPGYHAHVRAIKLMKTSSADKLVLVNQRIGGALRTPSHGKDILLNELNKFKLWCDTI